MMITPESAHQSEFFQRVAEDFTRAMIIYSGRYKVSYEGKTILQVINLLQEDTECSTMIKTVTTPLEAGANTMVQATLNALVMYWNENYLEKGKLNA